MLEAAHKRAQAENLAPRLILGDFRFFDLRRRFPLVIFPFNGLAHLLEDRDLFACLGQVAAHLETRGRFALDLPNPRPHLLSGNDERVFLSYDDPEGRRVEVYEESGYDAKERRSHVRWRHVSEAGEEVEELALRVFFPDELIEILSRAGFAVERREGDYDGRPFSPDAPQQLLVCLGKG